MFMLRSTCLCFLCHACAQIYMPKCSLPCLCLDIHAYVDLCLFGPRVMPMFRSMCLCAPCHVCVLRSICWLLMPCASTAFFSLYISLSYVLAFLGGVQIQISWSRLTSILLGLYQRVWIISLYTCVCLLASMLYVYACLSRSMLCYALGPLWACFCVVISIPLVAYSGVTTCETHPRDAGLLDAYPFSDPCVVVFHA